MPRLIDADALLEDARCDNALVAYLGGIETIQNIINDQPTIEAEPVKHGRWVPIEYDGYADGNPVWDLWECSECQEEHSGDEDTLTPYCPNCGAKMDGGGNA